MTDITEKEKKNYAYFQLVNQDYPNDFLGMVAYSIYKKSKVEYIRKYRSDHDGEPPDEEQIFEWQQSQCTSQQIELYKEKSANLITLFVNNAIDEKVTDINKKKEELIQVKTEIEKKGKTLEEKERIQKKKDLDLKTREGKAKKMEKICPANKNKFGTYFIAVSQSLVATLIYIIITIIIFVQQQWPIDVISNICNSIKNMKP